MIDVHFQSLVLFISRSSDLIYYLVLLLLLLLSGDVELNPGPMINYQPSSSLFAKYLKPLVDWKPFALCLPGITKIHVNTISRKEKNPDAKSLKIALHKIWLQANPTASWRDVINALKKCKEDKIAKTIEDKVTDPTDEVVTGNLKDILTTHYDELTQGISCDVQKTASALYAKKLIPQATKDHMLIPAISDFNKAAKLVTDIGHQLPSDNPEQYLIDVCHVLINQKNPRLIDIATSILHQLGQSIPDSDSLQLLSPVDDTPSNSIPVVPDDSVERVGYISHAIQRKDLKPGDHICSDRLFRSYTIHGIYIGEEDCEVIHFSGDDTGGTINKMSSLSQIRKTTLDDFCDGQTLRLVAYNCSVLKRNAVIFKSSCHTQKAMPPSETIKLAKYFLNHPKEFGKFGIMSKNSETFSCFCKTGLMDIAVQYQPLNWIPGVAQLLPKLPCESYEEAMKRFRRIKT